MSSATGMNRRGFLGTAAIAATGGALGATFGWLADGQKPKEGEGKPLPQNAQEAVPAIIGGVAGALAAVYLTRDCDQP
jgi:hypothetical protein